MTKGPFAKFDDAALARWQLYAERRVARVLEEEAKRRAESGGP